ncbi:epsin-like protein, putative [Rhizoctonia solani AG-3 Rhs1AP]|uniref:Epsin-like protein, putative n=1 Tax=Rhizoctonia solani AG-3 Rhs1AP TaxID=1086054 RepID=X8JMS7_9AGAM|nr:epsin-like protein, putative [Rhizoctonia solani AG-3 Rhs1AP]
MELGIMNASGPTFGLGPDPSGNLTVNRVIGVNITFTCAGLEPIQRSFFRSEWNSVHLGREPAEISGVANAFMRSDVVPPVMSRKHAEIILAGDTPQVMDIGSYHGTYFRSNGQRLIANQPYQLADGLVLEFGKSVTKDDKAHEPLLATIKFIRESDRGRFRIASRHLSSLLPPSSPPRRYSLPSDSEDEEEESDEDEMDSRSDVFEYNPHQHIDLTGLSDDSKSSPDTEGTDEGIECVGFGFSRAYDEESISGSDMSESEFEEETAKVISPPGGMSNSDLFGNMGPSPPGGVTTPAPAPISANPSVHGLITPPVELVAPAPISLPRLPRIETLSCLGYPEVGFYNPLPLPDFARHHMEVASRGPGLDFGYGGMEDVRSGPHMGHHQGGNQVGREHEESQHQAHLESEASRNIHEFTVQASHAAQVSQEVHTLKAELVVAQSEITELKRSLVEKEAAVVVVAEPPVVEPVAEDVPARIANIETMMTQLATVGDGEMCEHRTAVLDLLAQLASGIEALRIRVGYEAPKPLHQGQKRKRTDDEEDDEEVESRRAQSPAPMITPAPSAAPSPKRSRISINPAVSALVTGAAVWGALASGYL